MVSGWSAYFLTYSYWNVYNILIEKTTRSREYLLSVKRLLFGFDVPGTLLVSKERRTLTREKCDNRIALPPGWLWKSLRDRQSLCVLSLRPGLLSSASLSPANIVCSPDHCDQQLSSLQSKLDSSWDRCDLPCDAPDWTGKVQQVSLSLRDQTAWPAIILP